MIPRCVIVRDNGKHALADSDIDGVGNPFDLHDDAHAGQHQVAVGGSNHVDADVRDVKKPGQYGGRNSDGEKRLHVRAADSGRPARAHAERGLPGRFAVSVKQVQACQGV